MECTHAGAEWNRHVLSAAHQKGLPGESSALAEQGLKHLSSEPSSATCCSLCLSSRHGPAALCCYSSTSPSSSPSCCCRLGAMADCGGSRASLESCPLNKNCSVTVTRLRNPSSPLLYLLVQPLVTFPQPQNRSFANPWHPYKNSCFYPVQWTAAVPGLPVTGEDNK